MLGGYNLDDYDTPSKLPIGIAGIAAGCIGVAGAVVGMDEVWYIGPIGGKIGAYGGDLGFEVRPFSSYLAFCEMLANADLHSMCPPAGRYLRWRLFPRVQIHRDTVDGSVGRRLFSSDLSFRSSMYICMDSVVIGHFLQ